MYHQKTLKVLTEMTAADITLKLKAKKNLSLKTEKKKMMTTLEFKKDSQGWQSSYDNCFVVSNGWLSYLLSQERELVVTREVRLEKLFGFYVAHNQ